MKRILVGCGFTVVLMGALALGRLYAQPNPADHQHAQAALAATAKDEEPGVFCPTMKTGQLCSHGTSDLLQLSGDKKDQWVAAVRRYNKVVDQATLQLQEDAKTLLTPEQSAEVQRWFAKGLNPEINKILVVRGGQKSK